MIRARYGLAVAAAFIAASAALASAVAEELSAMDRDAIFTAAGFTKKDDQFKRCADDTSASYMPGQIELDDLNKDGRPEVWVKESSTFCYGGTAEAFVLLTKSPSGAWLKILDQVGVPLPHETMSNGWPDIEVGGPGGGPFPIYRFNGKEYVG